MSEKLNNLPTSYLAARGLLILIVIAMVASNFTNGASNIDHPGPHCCKNSSEWSTLAAESVFALACIIPFRLTLSGPLFWIRMTILLLPLGLWAVGVKNEFGVAGFRNYKDGTLDVGLIVTELILLGFSLWAPALLWRRRELFPEGLVFRSTDTKKIA